MLDQLPVRSLAFLGPGCLAAGGWSCDLVVCQQAAEGNLADPVSICRCCVAERAVCEQQRVWCEMNACAGGLAAAPSLMTPAKSQSPAFASKLAHFRSPGSAKVCLHCRPRVGLPASALTALHACRSL